MFQNEVLGMNWLNRLIETILNACGLDTTSKIGGQCSIFYLRYYKNNGTAWRVNFDYFVYSKLFSTGKNKKDTRQISWDMGQYDRCSARNSNTVLFLFLYSTVYRIYKRRFATWRYIFLFDFFAYG